MVRKKDQRVINKKNNQNPQSPHCRVVTLETIQTYRGHKPDKTVITKETTENPAQIAKICSSISEMQNLAIRSNSPPPNQLQTQSQSSSPPPSTATTSITNKSLKSKSPSPTLRKSVFSKFELECLEAHNEYRTKHCVPRLKLNKKLCRFAEEWAKIIATRGTAVHRNNSPYGENIFCAWSSTSDLVIGGKEPVDNW